MRDDPALRAMPNGHPQGDSLSDPCPPKTSADLDWGRILEAVAMRCEGDAGRRAAHALPFLPTRQAMLQALAEVREAFDLALAADPLPLAGLVDIAAAIERARIGAMLSSTELCAVRDALAQARRTRRYLQSRKERAPLLFASAATDPSLDKLEDLLSSAFDVDGTIADRASPRLGELRRERQATRDRLVRRLDELIRKHGDILQDGYWTERDGRYVLPLRTDSHERFPGIVHATSASGSTIFIEPRIVVGLGNRQKMLDSEVAREEEAVLVALSARVAERVHDVAAAALALAHLDVRAATAKLTEQLGLDFPEIPDASEGAVLELRAARHPILALDGIDVVASDLAVRNGHAVVVSGPNAGGKTVALKTMGLAVLMVRCGIPIAAKAGSRVAPFELVLTDVGDDQSLAKNLSTFSAHVKNLAAILDATRAGVLVLLDELAGGTDPREGEALAAAVLDSICARGGAVVCTTHYEGLKALALGDTRFENASVGFDLATMSPTFQLARGIPGASSALAVARRFGVPSTVLERAERFLTTETVSFETMVQKLDQERKALELARLDASREANSLRERREELDRELERIASRERALLTKEGEALLEDVRRARQDLRAAQARLRRGNLGEGELRAAEKVVDTVAAKVAIGGEFEPSGRAEAASHPPVDRALVRIGTKVFGPRLRATAEVIEVMPSGQLRVALGPLKLLTHIDEVKSAESSEAPAEARPARRDHASTKPSPFDAAADPDVPLSTSENTVDLRGLRSHEAIAMAEQFLDRCLGSGRRVAFLVHGHGTGALRKEIRASLETSRYVARMRGGEPREGGDGVTVVWLR